MLAWLSVPETRQVNATSPIDHRYYYYLCIDPLAWWKLHDSRFPRISKLASKYLAPFAPSEVVFSRAKLIQHVKDGIFFPSDWRCA